SAGLKGKLTTTKTPAGKTVHMQPMAIDQPDAVTELSFPAKYGENTDDVLAEAGFTTDNISQLREAGIIPA
ncbi:MAG: CoA transferase, partial [Rhodospirillales bacterium]|nr:CoA transferase [Rhodospirillales bacterium]